MSEVPLYPHPPNFMYNTPVPSSLPTHHTDADPLSVPRRASRGTSLTRNRPPPLGPPQGPRHSPTVGSYGVAGSYKRGTPVPFPRRAGPQISSLRRANPQSIGGGFASFRIQSWMRKVGLSTPTESARGLHPQRSFWRRLHPAGRRWVPDSGLVPPSEAVPPSRAYSYPWSPFPPRRARPGPGPHPCHRLAEKKGSQPVVCLRPIGRDTVEPIPTLGALFPRGGPVQDPVLTCIAIERKGPAPQPTNPKPQILHPKPYTLHPTTSTLHPEFPNLRALSPQRETLSPKPYPNPQGYLAHWSHLPRRTLQ